LGRVTREAAALDGGLATLVLFALESITGNVLGLGFKRPVTGYMTCSTNNGTRIVGAMECFARRKFIAALDRITLAHTHCAGIFS